MKDDAAAEVIGVILIVAITVIIATIVAAFAFGMGSSIKKPYEVYFKLDKPAPMDYIVITNFGGTDLNMLHKLEISYTTASGIQTEFAEPSAIISSNPGHASGDLSNQITPPACI